VIAVPGTTVPTVLVADEPPPLSVLVIEITAVAAAGRIPVSTTRAVKPRATEASIKSRRLSPDRLLKADLPFHRSRTHHGCTGAAETLTAPPCTTAR